MALVDMMMDICNGPIKPAVLLLFFLCAFAVLLADAKPYATILNDDEPLFLTPYLENGEINKAKQLANVPPIMANEKSYAGFLTVNKTYDSNHFFWFFPAIESPESAPVVVWLQGGPGASSMHGLFYENGPYGINDSDWTPCQREYSWTKTMSVLYIDNPVGTGFSFTNHDDGYCKNEQDVAANLYQTIVQFFKLFPELLENEFYVTGESYGGKYAPALAFAIHEGNKAANLRINLKGVAIGDGFADPFNMVNYGEYLNKLGLIDNRELVQFDEKRDQIRELIQAGKMEEARIVRRDLIFGLFLDITGFEHVYNYLHTSSHYMDDLSDQIMQDDAIRKKIHVGNVTFHSYGSKSYKYLKNDIMRSVVPWIEALLENGYKFMTYNGQLDILDAYPLTVEYVEKLNWAGAEEYKTSKRHIWKVQADDEEVAGYVRVVRNLYEVLVLGAGHMVPADKPRAAYDLINRFVHNISFV